MTKRLVIAAAAALLASGSASQASIAITGSYTAVDGTASNSSYAPWINYMAPSINNLPSPFTENLSVGTTTAPTDFFAVAPKSGNASVGNVTGSITVKLTLNDGSGVSGVTYNGNAATLSGSTITVNAYYGLFYGNQTDCITWSSTTCSANNNTTTIGDQLGITFADGAVLDVNLYNWSDWNMAPNISFDLVQGPYVPAVPEPASFAVLGTALAGLGALLWRRRQATAGSTAAQ